MIIFIIVFLIGIIAVIVDDHRHIMTIFLCLMIANCSGCLAAGFIQGDGIDHRWHFWPVSFISFTLICLSSTHVAISYKLGRLPDLDMTSSSSSSSSMDTRRRRPFPLRKQLQRSLLSSIKGKKKSKKKNPNHHHRHRLFETISLDSIDSNEQSFNSNPSSV
ncbi:hypothetical protein HUG17_8372 [Dermatophagoides farinae]|uniref:Uncharacterized protein n=1 Tax=Dermatophagoides farinae TaxID=6954 RepID=A0A9D4NYZ6_DERFA|nr:hypothetical protein HUG17_8372 [Dermatophagoides farinae]